MYLLRIKTVYYTFEQMFHTRKEAEDKAKLLLSRDKAIEYVIEKIDGGLHDSF